MSSWLLNQWSCCYSNNILVDFFNREHCTVVLVLIQPSIPGLYNVIQVTSARNSIFLGNINLFYFMVLFLKAFWSFLVPLIALLPISAFLELIDILSFISSIWLQVCPILYHYYIGKSSIDLHNIFSFFRLILKSVIFSNKIKVPDFGKGFRSFSTETNWLLNDVF